MAIVFAILGVTLLALWLLERFMCGTHVESLLYNRPIKVGEKMHIYMDGVFNRTAIVSRVEPYRVFIYGKIPLAIRYRGRFYAIGETCDGRRLVYVPNRNYYRWVNMAEVARKVFNIPSNAYMLEPDSDYSVEDLRNVSDSENSEDEA